MISETEIISYLKQKYQPLAIYVSGSRARGKNRPDSDWDVHLVVNDATLPISEKINMTSIDVKYVTLSNINTSIIDTPYSPAVPFLTLFRDVNYLVELKSYEQRTEVAYEAGPKKWTEAQFQDNQTRLQRFLEAINGTTQDELICFRHICKFFDLVLIYWFGIRNRWSLPIYDAIELYKTEDPAFYSSIMSLVKAESIQDKAKIANKVYRNLYKFSRPNF